MSEILSAEEIAALVEAAKQGKVPDHAAGPRRRTPRIRTVDFARPTKFTIEHTRRISRAIDTFCQTAATRLASELRLAIELEAISTTQVNWSAGQSQIAPGSLTVPIEVQPVGTHMLLAVERSLVLMGIECLLGGSPDRPPRERRFSEIDWVLARRLVETLVHQLSLVWDDMAGVTLRPGEVDLQSDVAQIVSVSEPTLAVAIESRVNKNSFAVTLLIPWNAIEEISPRMIGRDGAADAPERLAGITRAVSAVPITLRAEVAAVDLPVEEVLSLAPGSIIRLGASAESGISIFAEHVKLCDAAPGANGRRRAVQVRHRGS